MPVEQTPPIVSILVVSYNTRDLTLECIASVFDETDSDLFELIVVDNASSDGSADAIDARFGDRITLVRLDTNVGFAAANNLAAQKARGRYILLLNPDTVVLDRAIERLLNFADERREHGIWGGRTVSADRSLNPSSCWRRMTIWGLICNATGLRSLFRRSSILNPEGYGGWKRDSVREVDVVTGCWLLIHREVWEELGGFDERYFMYGEDADLCLRARKLGRRPIVTPEATIVHYGGASETVKPDKIVRLLRAKSQLIRDHWSPLTAPVGIGLLRMSVFSRCTAHRFASVIRGPGTPDPDGKWRTVWRRRGEWVG